MGRNPDPVIVTVVGWPLARRLGDVCDLGDHELGSGTQGTSERRARDSSCGTGKARGSESACHVITDGGRVKVTDNRRSHPSLLPVVMSLRAQPSSGDPRAASS